MRDILQKTIQHKELTEEDVSAIVNSIVSNSFMVSQMSGLLCSLQTRMPMPSEIARFVRCLMKEARTLALSDAVDICGTGGDKKSTFNISTAVLFVLAGAGIKVAKHGNKAISSSSGSFDVLAELGIRVPDDSSDSYQKTGVALLFAPLYHPAFKNIGPLRKELGVQTIFNILGPLLNPGQVRRQLMGVYDPGLVRPIALAMKELGHIHGMVVHGNGLDEITVTGPSAVSELTNGAVTDYTIDPIKYGIEYSPLDYLIVSSPKESAKVILDVLNGKKSPCRDIVILNSAAGIKIAGKAATFEQGIALAKEAIDSGKALQALRRLQQ